MLFEKFGQHQPLNRRAERYARERVDLSLSTLADQVGACAAALVPLYALLQAHVLSAERLHGDDTTVPVLAKGGSRTGRHRSDLDLCPRLSPVRGASCLVPSSSGAALRGRARAWTAVPSR